MYNKKAFEEKNLNLKLKMALLSGLNHTFENAKKAKINYLD
jgi:hypothetical protein